MSEFARCEAPASLRQSMWVLPLYARVSLEDQDVCLSDRGRELLCTDARRHHCSSVKLGLFVVKGIVIGLVAAVSLLAAGAVVRALFGRVPIHEVETRQATAAFLEASLFQQVDFGNCADSQGGWLPIVDADMCRKASKDLGLRQNEPKVTTEVGRPEGCYYFRSLKDRSESLWLSTNSINKGQGAMVRSDGRRDPICMAQSGARAVSSTSELAVVAGGTTIGKTEQWLIAALTMQDGFQKISVGRCEDRGWHAINQIAVCEAAAQFLGLADTQVEVTRQQDRPEGCYMLKVFGRPSRLWVSINPANRGTGAQRTIYSLREPICSAPPGPTYTSTTNGTFIHLVSVTTTSSTLASASVTPVPLPHLVTPIRDRKSVV